MKEQDKQSLLYLLETTTKNAIDWGAFAEDEGGVTQLKEAIAFVKKYIIGNAEDYVLYNALPVVGKLVSDAYFSINAARDSHDAILDIMLFLDPFLKGAGFNILDGVVLDPYQEDNNPRRIINSVNSILKEWRVNTKCKQRIDMLNDMIKQLDKAIELINYED